MSRSRAREPQRLARASGPVITLGGETFPGAEMCFLPAGNGSSESSFRLRDAADHWGDLSHRLVERTSYCSGEESAEGVARWAQMEQDAVALPPELERRFESGVNKAIVTLPCDGAWGISPMEMEFDDGEVSFRIMSGSARLLDVRRDPASRSIARTASCRRRKTLSPYRPGPAKLARLAAEIPPPADTVAA